jgi:hypothetical protein
MTKQIITGFLPILDSKLKKQKEMIQKELDKPKGERNRHALKDMLKQTKKLRKTLKDAKEHTKAKCPHCGGDI